ncbi:hypothetical protein LCGC14_2542110 [marine sediment metagenome]|uniref:Uncharacterized protein n=1 Tax=marine sediment metagenome TaxID=412755 RepID=A0A0F9AQV8_9ZZZZ
MVKQSSIKKSILKKRGVELAPRTKKLLTYDDTPTPYAKTRLMKYLELKHGAHIEKLISVGNIYTLEKQLGVDATTISKWRKKIDEAREAEFFNQFNNMEGD